MRILLIFALISSICWAEINGVVVFSNKKINISNKLKFKIFQLNKRFYKIECSKNHESNYTKNFVCELNSNKNGSFSVTAYADLVRPLNYIDFSYILVHRTSNNTVFNTSFEYCSSNGNLHPFLQFFLGLLKTFAKDLIHPCPYKPANKIGIDKWFFEGSGPAVPLIQQRKGDYKASLNCKDKEGSLIFYTHLYCLFTPKKTRKN